MQVYYQISATIVLYLRKGQCHTHNTIIIFRPFPFANVNKMGNNPPGLIDCTGNDNFVTLREEQVLKSTLKEKEAAEDWIRKL